MKRLKSISHARSWRSKSVGLKQSSAVPFRYERHSWPWFLHPQKILLVPTIQLTLKDESLEFLGIRTIEQSWFPDFVLGGGSVWLDKFIDSLGKYGSFTLDGACYRILISGFTWSLIICRVNVCRFGLCGMMCRGHVLALGIGYSWGSGFNQNFFRIHSWFRLWLQLMCCAYLLSLSKYFKWGWTLDFRIKSKTSLHSGDHRRVMKLEVQPSELAFRFDSWDSKVRFLSIKVCK